MTGQIIPPSGQLVSPIIGDQTPVIGATAAIGRAIKGVSDKQHQLVGCTVSDVPNSSAGKSTIAVTLDTDPATLVQGHTMNGWVPQPGARMMALLYPPRGVLLLGQISDSQLATRMHLNDPNLGNYVTEQTFANGAAGGDLYLQGTAGHLILREVLAPQYRWQFTREAGVTHNLTSTAFAVVSGASAAFTLPASGVVQIHHKTQLIIGVAGQSMVADVQVSNVTQGTIPYGGSTNNGSSWSGVQPAGSNVGGVGVGNSIVGFITLGAGGQGGILGNEGDTMLINMVHAISATGTPNWQILETQFSFMCSL